MSIKQITVATGYKLNKAKIRAIGAFYLTKKFPSLNPHRATIYKLTSKKETPPAYLWSPVYSGKFSLRNKLKSWVFSKLCYLVGLFNILK